MFIISNTCSHSTFFRAAVGDQRSVSVDLNEKDEERDIQNIDAEEIQRFSLSVSIQVSLADFRENRTEVGRCFADILSDMSPQEKCSNVNFLPAWTDTNCGSASPQIILSELLTSKEKLFTFTGLHSQEMLDTLVDCVKVLVKDSATNKKNMSLTNRIVLTLVKIKQNMDFSAIGVLFSVNRQTCSNYFKEMCPILAIVLKVVIPWPDQSLIRCNLPLSFQNFRNTRVVLDCCEVTLETCKCLKCRVLTYSQYKKKHTIKFNMGVAPSGLITERSLAFGGRASDKLIVEESGILGRCDYGDGVMVDKGYRIEKQCMEVCVYFLSSSAFS